MPGGPAVVGLGGGSVAEGWPPRTPPSWSGGVGAGASVGPAHAPGGNPQAPRDGLGGAQANARQAGWGFATATTSGDVGESVRFFAIGDWGNPSRRLKKVAKVMSVLPECVLKSLILLRLLQVNSLVPTAIKTTAS